MRCSFRNAASRGSAGQPSVSSHLKGAPFCPSSQHGFANSHVAEVPAFRTACPISKQAIFDLSPSGRVKFIICGTSRKMPFFAVSPTSVQGVTCQSPALFPAFGWKMLVARLENTIAPRVLQIVKLTWPSPKPPKSPLGEGGVDAFPGAQLPDREELAPGEVRPPPRPGGGVLEPRRDAL